ncbi:ABC transporter ATP-binding protein [Luteipulveratus flavus]|uniref:ABC transporter ATP-binding protein n=1 Tax=Luteipulveratus flavus TaxID=3031728 RepID=A0ABT6C263_9MICO|nr:ABC transporter ATP-binding protein [Luteipulveratus sp. YIM 133296]MDF8262750.1 ABC transporter ATP-binding protein [Luteipulveratus sp. YIM 133296]
MSVHLDGSTRRGDFTLELALDVEPGEVVAVLGPNGSGKTTLVDVLAGLTGLTEGALSGPGGGAGDAAGAVGWDAPASRTWVAPQQRRVGLVLADPLLFPHLSVRDNVAFGPRSRGAGRATGRRTADAELATVGLADRAGARPSTLSTGQAQRVALARALAGEPRLLLLDEPLSALDAETRVTTRATLAARLRTFEGCTVLVTHDPLDALTIADRLVFLDAGRVVQVGTPHEVVSRPRNPYVARVVGLNLWRATADATGVVRLDGGAAVQVAEPPDAADVWVTVRPSAVALWPQEPHGSPRNGWRLTVVAVELAGQSARVSLTGRIDLVAEVTAASVAELSLHPGTEVWATVKATEVSTYAA